jgi:hypothetical protein
MMILKGADERSDEKILKNSIFNMLYSNELGLFNLNDSIPTESTYYLFRQKVTAYDRNYVTLYF